MILYYGTIGLKTGNHKPLMKRHAGQTWVTAKIHIDKKPIECHFDQRLGSNLYFEFKDNWYYVRMSSQYCDLQQYSFNPLTEKVKLKTKV